MKSKLTVSCAVVVVSMFVSVASVAAQTASTATVLGTATDASGAVIPGATVDLTDLATNVNRSQISDRDGQYLFPNVVPGTYRVTVSMSGFQQVTVPSLKIEVAKTYTVSVTLPLGGLEDKVVVTASAGVELQTFNATVGNVIGSDYLLRLPLLDRQSNSLLQLQPSVTPGGYGSNSGNVAGARSDQTTWIVDGVDVTESKSGSTGSTSFPLPAESVEEFRVGVTNADASFGRSSGGQLTAVRKRGGNQFHGSAYWYHQNDNLNANTWTRNRLGQKDPELKDHRFGLTVGGPIIKEKTFFFFHYEGRRFPQSQDILRLVPTDTLRAGILRFRDGAGAIVDYPLATTARCGPTGTAACDPRGVGMSPVVSDILALYPRGNDSSSGDGLNTIGFRAPASASQASEYAWLRFDHHFTEAWRFEGSFGWFRNLANSTGQVDIGGLLSGNVRGEAKSLRSSRNYPRNITAALTGQITPRLTNELRFGFLRSYSWSTATRPFPLVPRANIAFDLAGTLLDEPVDVLTTRSRSMGDNQQLYHFSDNLLWLKGRHVFQFGGSGRTIRHFHGREDRTGSAMTTLIGLLDTGTFTTVPAGQRPPTCVGSQSNCLRAADGSRWNRLYAAALGIVDNVSVLITRDSNFNANPFGVPLDNHFKYHAWELYASDVWRVHPSLTISYGLNYQVQIGTKETDGRIAIPIDASSGKSIIPDEYLNARRDAALKGAIFNPQIGYTPIGKTGRENVVDTDWNNIGPRIASAWNPRYQNGVLGKVFGDRKTVLRGGYSLIYDRSNLLQLTSTPMQSAGFSQTLQVQAPVNAIGQPFRVGVDGPAPLPTVPSVSPPFIPGVPFGETFTLQIDPTFTIGKNHSFDFTIQRELPGDMIVELGYVGRLGRNLPQNVNLNSIPFFMLDSRSGQSFAVAYDAVAAQLRSGVAANAVTAQPWFENQLPPIATLRSLGLCGTAFTAVTNCLASRFTSQIIDGLVSTFWLNGIDTFRRTAGMQTLSNAQVLEPFVRTDGGISNYHAFVLTFRKRPSYGLQFDFNYTLSKSLDRAGVIQNSATMFSSSFLPSIDYGPSFFDFRHIANLSWYYELPFARGRRSHAGKGLGSILGGWHVGGIVTASSGAPLTVVHSNQVFGGGTSTFPTNTGAIPIGKPNFGNSVNHGVAGSGGVGSTGNPATGGTGLNLFAEPEKVLKSFRPVLISQDTRGGSGVLRGLPHWNMDFSLGRRIFLKENVRFLFSLDCFNVLNRAEFANPSLDLRNPQTFGVLSAQFNVPRLVQIGLRVEF